jgi:citrate lyase subunit beta/citryl-CoA lyase
MGTSDLTKDLHARHTRDRLPLVTSLELCVLAARAAGVAALDGVHLDLDDDAGFEAACRQAADLGFDGKTLIHPKTIARANAIFAAAPADVDWARRVIAAHAEAMAQARGIVLLDGRLIENLHVDEARRVVALADAIEFMGGSGRPPSPSITRFVHLSGYQRCPGRREPPSAPPRPRPPSADRGRPPPGRCRASSGTP